MMSQSAPQTTQQKHATPRPYQTVTVMGLGYVGLPTALLYAKRGFQVHGVDVSSRVLNAIEAGRIPQMYPELASWWHEVEHNHAFHVSSTPIASDVFIITVPTPWDHDTHQCDLTAVKSAVSAILPVLTKGNVIILESTVGPGTTRNVIQPMIEAEGYVVGEDIHLCFSPERVLPGNTIQELVQNDRVLGGTTLDSAMLAKEILGRVIEGEIYVTTDVTAEFCKLAENTYRDVNIALANELSLVAEKLGVNIQEALPIINQHPRVNLHRPGIGVGGHCIAVDPWFFVEAAPELTPLIATARAVNDGMPQVCVNKLMSKIAHIQNPKVVAAGLTYKPDVADTRESPAMEVVRLLKAQGVDVDDFDPMLPQYDGQTLQVKAQDADLLVVLVQHSVFKAELSLHRHAILDAMRTPQIVVF